MIYRLSEGAIKEWKKQLASGMLVLAVTLGFPVLAAWLNYERHNLSTFPNGSLTQQGAVLGESTNGEPADPDSAGEAGQSGQPDETSPPTPTQSLSANSGQSAGPSASGSEDPIPDQPSSPTDPSPSVTVRPKEPTEEPHIINLVIPGLFDFSIDP